MSHTATSWAIKQRGIKPAAKIVLFHLADHHNPTYGCFPSQETLAEICEMSKRSVQDQLGLLEARGLISREKCKRPSGVYQSDRYILGFEKEFTQTPCAKSATGKIAPKPVANSRGIHAQNLPPNLVSEPLSLFPPLSPIEILAELVGPEIAQDFVEHRKEMKKPMTERGARAMVKKLSGCHDPGALMTSSIADGYRGVYPPKQNGTGNGKVTTSQVAEAGVRIAAELWPEKYGGAGNS